MGPGDIRLMNDNSRFLVHNFSAGLFPHCQMHATVVAYFSLPSLFDHFQYNSVATAVALFLRKVNPVMRRYAVYNCAPEACCVCVVL